MQFNLNQRVNKLRDKLQLSPFDALIISSVQNCRYLSGFANDDANVGYLIVSMDAMFLVTDYRYSEQANSQCQGVEVIERDRANVSLGQQINTVLKQLNVKHVAFERDHIGYGMIEDVIAQLANIKASGISGWVEQMRLINDDSEIIAIKTAANIADEALAAIVSFLKAGISERDASLELEYQMQKAGSQGLSFPTIFISGERTSLPHGMPSERVLSYGDLITLDFGAVIDGYRSDMTRAFVVGEPTAKQIEVYETVKMAQQVGIQSVKAGIKGSQPYLETKKVLDASPYGEFQGEGLGHGVGLFLHEQPFLQKNCTITLQQNMVITIEPGIYIPGWGGVRIEDDIRITENGCEMLTHAPRALVIIE
jgi:Xaa-Pro aminopeptidase/Xaa-Pro dipeptidase